MHEKLLLIALEQARLGRGLCAPNPSVGAVAVQNGTIISQSYHQGAGTPHAEQLLLAQIPPKLPGLSLYITLEPCNHWGKTPPCIDSIIQYGVEEVFFSYRDPNPLVARNNSSAQLEAQGIKVTHIPLQPVTDFYQSYAYWTQTQRPRVTVKMAQSLDAKIGSLNAERLLLSNELCATFTQEQRAATDVILSSARTVQLDNPKMNVRLKGQEKIKPLALIDQHLYLNPAAQIFSTAGPKVIYHHDLKEVDYKDSCFYQMPLKNGTMDLNAIISHLGSLGYHDVWVEVGAQLFSALHREGLVHRTYLYLTPFVIGETNSLAYQYHECFDRNHRVSWQGMADNVIACFDWLED